MNKEDNYKYDRQIRLWGVEGQKLIDSTSLVVFGSSILVTEFLKSMTLHAVHKIYIIDDAKVDQTDTLQNFFVESDTIGQDRAVVTANLLKELNSDPEFEPIIDSPTNYAILNDPKFDSSCFIITYGTIKPSKMNELSEIVRGKHMRQAHFACTGFYGGIYLDGGSHYAFQGGSMFNQQDWHLVHPIPALLKYIEDSNYSSLSGYDKIQYPWIIKGLVEKQRLIKRMEELEKTTGEAPVITADTLKKQCEIDCEFVDTQILLKDVIDNRLQFFREPNYPNLTKAIKQSEKMPDTDFWKCVRAIKKFKEDTGDYPVIDTIPDLECKNKIFLDIKKIYKEKYLEDVKKMKEYLPDVEESFVADFVRYFSKIAGHEYKPLSEVIQTVSPKPAINYQAEYVEVCFIAAREFAEKENRAPQVGDESAVYEIAKKHLPKDHNLDPETELKKTVDEYVRFNDKAVPSVASTVAAFTAQEVTKMIIRQQTPVRYPAIFDFIRNKTSASGEYIE